MLTTKEKNYLDIIFKAVPLMSDFEKGRLVGYAEALYSNSPENNNQTEDSAASVLTDYQLPNDKHDDSIT